MGDDGSVNARIDYPPPILTSMDAATVSSIISGGAGLIGAIVGGSVTLLSTSRQHKLQTKGARQAAIRDQEHRAAKECEELCMRMAEESEHIPHPANANHDDSDHQRQSRVRDAHSKLDATALYLPAELRERIETLGNIVFDVEEICFGSGPFESTHYDGPYTVCWHVKKEVRAIVAAFLQDKTLPAQGARINEYRTALIDLNRQREEFYSEVESADERSMARERSREAFYKQHPELR